MPSLPGKAPFPSSTSTDTADTTDTTATSRGSGSEGVRGCEWQSGGERGQGKNEQEGLER